MNDIQDQVFPDKEEPKMTQAVLDQMVKALKQTADSVQCFELTCNEPGKNVCMINVAGKHILTFLCNKCFDQVSAKECHGGEVDFMMLPYELLEAGGDDGKASQETE